MYIIMLFKEINISKSERDRFFDFMTNVFLFEDSLLNF